MCLRVTLCFLLFTALTVNAQTAINLHGKVSNQAGKPIANAIVTLVQQGLKDTSGADGAYSIMKATPVVMPIALVPRFQTIVLEKGFLEFSLPDPSPVKVQIYDVRGKLLKKEILPNASRGFYRFNIEECARASKVLIINTSIDRDEFTFRYLPLHGSKYVINQYQKDPTEAGGKLAKLTAVSDTLKVTATGYTAKAIAIASYDQELNVTLDTVGDKGVRPSSGCGKTAAFKGETQVTINVTAAGTGDRMYYIRIPDDYDPNHPYALWFTPHCLNGSAENVAHSEPDTKARYEYLGMWRCANPAGGKGTTIFCAPQGINSGWGSGQKDLEFFRAMIKKFESELCVDESRIFSSGFSMGGSMSYALACAMPDTIRAIAMHEGGSMSGCDQSHRGPVPAIITVGTQDNWPNMGVPQLADLAKRDGCTAVDIPAMVASGQINPPDQMHPVCVDYKNCDAGYPCRAYIFKGGHIGSPGTLGSYGKNDTWVPDSTWKFMKQFY
jgi:poly(3-hydroxybutyrate) depolymerase